MIKKIVTLMFVCLMPLLAFAQQDQTTTAISQRNNVKYVNGVGIGYRPTAGSGLTLNISGGTNFSCGSISTYTASTLTMTASTTNYVYLNTSASCVPATKTTTFASTDVPIAVVVAGSSAITSITDDRTIFSSAGGGGVSATNPQLTEGSSLSAGSWSGSGIPGTSLTVGKLYYYGASGLALAKADSASTLPAVCLSVSTTLCAFSGVYRFLSSQSWTSGDELYVSDASAGSILNSTPTTSGHYVQRVGEALANDTILIMPSVDVGGLQ